MSDEGIAGQSEQQKIERFEDILKWDKRLSELEVQLAESRPGGLPWWKKGGLVAVITAIIATIPPLTTAVSAYVEGSQARLLDEKKSQLQRRDKYVDLALAPTLTDQQRLNVFEYLAVDFKGDTLEGWALAKLEEVRELEQALKNLEKAKADMLKLEEDNAELEARVASGDASEAEVKRLRGALIKSNQERDAAEERVREASSALENVDVIVESEHMSSFLIPPTLPEGTPPPQGWCGVANNAFDFYCSYPVKSLCDSDHQECSPRTRGWCFYDLNTESWICGQSLYKCGRVRETITRRATTCEEYSVF